MIKFALVAFVLAVGLTVGLAGNTLAQNVPASSVYTGLEGLIFSGMTPQQQNNYNAIQTYMNFSTQVVTMAFYKAVEKKFDRDDLLNPFEASILVRGPFAITTGNQAFVPIGSGTTQ